MSNVLETCLSHRILHGELLIRGGDLVLLAATQENRSEEKAVARFKASATFGYLLLVDPFQKNPDHMIPGGREQRCQVARPLRSA